MFLEWDRVKVFVRPGAADLRKQINGLAALVVSVTSCDPGSSLFVTHRSRRTLNLWRRGRLPPSIHVYGLAFVGSRLMFSSRLPPYASLYSLALARPAYGRLSPSTPVYGLAFVHPCTRSPSPSVATGRLPPSLAPPPYDIHVYG
jgi:hypothetical protein